MLLAFDIGNTNITVGIYQGDKLKRTYRLTTKMKRTSDEYGFMIINFLNDANITNEDIEDVIIASVVPKVMHSFRNSIRKYLHKEPIIVGPGIKTGISVQMENPKAVGADRIVDCAGAYYVYGGPALIVDFGTATTFDYIDEKGYRSKCPLVTDCSASGGRDQISGHHPDQEHLCQHAGRPVLRFSRTDRVHHPPVQKRTGTG